MVSATQMAKQGRHNYHPTYFGLRRTRIDLE